MQSNDANVPRLSEFLRPSICEHIVWAQGWNRTKVKSHNQDLSGFQPVCQVSTLLTARQSRKVHTSAHTGVNECERCVKLRALFKSSVEAHFCYICSVISQKAWGVFFNHAWIEPVPLRSELSGTILSRMINILKLFYGGSRRSRASDPEALYELSRFTHSVESSNDPVWVLLD